MNGVFLQAVYRQNSHLVSYLKIMVFVMGSFYDLDFCEYGSLHVTACQPDEKVSGSLKVPKP